MIIQPRKEVVFMAKIVINGLPGLEGARSDPTRPELDATAQLYEAHGFELHGDMSGAGLLVGIGRAFVPDQLPPASMIANAGASTQQYFNNTVQPALRSGLEKNNPQTMALAIQLGRLIGASIRYKRLINAEPPVVVEAGNLTVDGHTFPFKLATGNILEYGMGLNGLASHAKQVRAEQYNVIAAQRNPSEVIVLRSAARYLGLDEQQMAITDQGIPHTVNGLIANGNSGLIDAIVASRVHGADTDLRYGIANSAELLHEEGLLVARGPRLYRQGHDYDRVLRQVRGDSRLQLAHTHTFMNPAQYPPEACRLVVARKAA
jgi:hypothetical protein